MQEKRKQLQNSSFALELFRIFTNFVKFIYFSVSVLLGQDTSASRYLDPDIEFHNIYEISSSPPGSTGTTNQCSENIESISRYRQISRYRIDILEHWFDVPGAANHITTDMALS